MVKILQNDEIMKFKCPTFYVEGVSRAEKFRYPASGLLPVGVNRRLYLRQARSSHSDTAGVNEPLFHDYPLHLLSLYL